MTIEHPECKASTEKGGHPQDAPPSSPERVISPPWKGERTDAEIVAGDSTACKSTHSTLAELFASVGAELSRNPRGGLVLRTEGAVRHFSDVATARSFALACGLDARFTVEGHDDE